jgi:hypothetical protein
MNMGTGFKCLSNVVRAHSFDHSPANKPLPFINYTEFLEEIGNIR